MKISPLIQFYTSKPTLKNDKKQSVQCPVNSYSTKLSAENYSANLMPKFTSLKYKAGDNNYCDTSFFRDVKTLSQTADYLQKNFPRGTDIMDFASSSGQEAISLHALLNDKKKRKYTIHCYDVSGNIVEIARLGTHPVYSAAADDAFLLAVSTRDKRQRALKKAFEELMEPTLPPSYKMNDPDFIDFVSKMYEGDFKIQYFKIRDKYRNNFTFNVGDIRNIDEILPDKKAGAVLFRNAFYIITNNFTLNEFNYERELNNKVNKEKVINEVVDKVYEKLLPGGIFVLGDNEKEHLYIADEHLTESERLASYYATDVYKYSPLYNALNKDGRFSPICTRRIRASIGYIDAFTIWKKNK